MRPGSGLAALFLASAVAFCEQAERPKVHVILEDSTAVDWTTLSVAKLTAAAILNTADVKLQWNGAPKTPRCGNTTIRLRLDRSAPSELLPGALGFALPYASGTTTVTVFLDRVRPLLATNQNSRGAILGHVIAHELTHVLQGIARHTESGLMKRAWDEDDIQSMGVQPMKLTSGDATLIRRRISQCSTLTEKAER